MLFSPGMGRLLILSSNTGEGHNSAARAIENAAGQAGWNVSLRKPLEDSASEARLLASLYNFLLTHRPGWVRLFARTIDWVGPNEADFFYRRVRAYIERFIELEKPGTILSVHPMLNHMIQRWVRERNMGIRCYTFVTDPFPPFWKGWISPYVDRYFVLTDDAATSLVGEGVPSNRIERVSMPLRPGFRPRQPSEVTELRSRLEVEGETIVINGGARGGGPLRALAHTVLEAAPTANVLVLCGHNARIRKRLDQIPNRRLRTYGFVEDIHSLIGAADLVITKPGALSTYEALASAVPAVLTGVGGLMPQESGLFNAASHYGFGFAVRTLDELRAVLRQGVAEWRTKRDAIVQFYRPGSTPELIERIQLSHG